MASLKRNFAYNLIYQVILIVIPLITVPYVSRVLGPKNIGIYSYTLSIATYFVLIAMLGVKNYGNRSISRAKDDKTKLDRTFWEIYYLQLGTSLLMIVIYIIYLVSFSNYPIIAMVQVVYIFTAVFDISWFFFGLEKFKITVTRGLIVKIIGVISIFIFVNGPDDLSIYVLIMALTMMLSQLALWPELIKYVDFVRPVATNICAHIKPNLVLFIPVIAISLYTIMDKVMVGALSTMSELGYYENTVKIVGLPFGIITALGNVMIPRMSHLYAMGNTKGNEKYISISMKFIFFIGSAMMFGIAGIAPTLAPVFLGDKFIPVGALLTVITPIILFKAWANIIRTQFLIPRLRDKEYVGSVIWGAVVNLILNIILIIPFGAMGAVIGSIVAELTVAIHQTLYVKNELNIYKYLKSGIFFIVNGCLMFIILRLIGNFMNVTIVTLFIELITGTILYLSICLLYIVFVKKVDIKKIISNGIKNF